MRITFLIIMFLNNLYFAQDSTDVRLEKLFELIGMKTHSEYFFEYQILQIKDEHPEISENILDTLRLKFKYEDPFYNLLIPKFKQAFSSEEIQKLIQLYESDEFIKFSKFQEASSEEYGILGARWGRKTYDKLLEYLKNNNYINIK